MLFSVVFTLRPSKCNHSKGGVAPFGGRDGFAAEGLFGEGTKWV